MRVREGSYPIPGGVVEFCDADTIREIADLYVVAEEDYKTGTSNLANDQLRQMLTDVFQGKNLSAVQWNVLKRLRNRYATEYAALNAKPDKDGQDYFSPSDLNGPGPVSRT